MHYTNGNELNPLVKKELLILQKITLVVAIYSHLLI